MKYFRRLGELLGLEVQFSEEASNKIDAFEQQYNKRAPDSIREWFTHPQLNDGFDTSGNEFKVTSLEEFLATFARPDCETITFIGPDQVNTGYEAIIAFDGSDDPPVDDFHSEEKPPFSTYVKQAIWHQIECERPFAIDVREAKASPEAIDYLESNYELFAKQLIPPLDADDTPLYVFNFFKGQEKISLSSDGDPAGGTCSARYSLITNDLNSLIDLYATFWPAHEGEAMIIKQGVRTGEHDTFFKQKFPAMRLPPSS